MGVIPASLVSAIATLSLVAKVLWASGKRLLTETTYRQGPG